MSHRTLKFLLTAAALASLCPTLVGCGAESSPYSLTESRANPVNAALEPYLQEFLALFNQPANLVPLTLGPLEKGVAGKCFKGHPVCPTAAIGRTFVKPRRSSAHQATRQRQLAAREQT